MDHRGITPEDIEKMDAKVQSDEAAAAAAANASKGWGGSAGSQKTAEQTDEEKKLMEEWEQHMSDFVPEDITTIQIDPRREVVSTHCYNME